MKAYQICKQDDVREMARFLAKSGQMIVPFVELIESSQIAVDVLIEQLGRATIQSVLAISAASVAGEPHQGRRGRDVVRHGSQPGVVCLSNRKVRVERPRLRRRGGGAGGEVAIPAYEAMQEDGRLGAKVLDTLMRCVSTRSYEKVLPECSEAVGVSKSSVSRRFIEASEAALKELLERRFDDVRFLVIWIDGIVFGDHSVIAAVGLDESGHKHILRVVEGATENATVVKALLEGLVEQGILPGIKRLFVIDGSKALRKAIEAVYGAENPVQRCRLHKVRNVCDHLPEEQKAYAKLVMRAAFRLDAQKGTKRLEELAGQYENACPGAAASLREGLPEMFTVERLGVPKNLSRCLVSTNIIESPNAGVRMRTGRVCRWKDGAMVLRWAATAFVATEQQFRRVLGYRELWMLKAALDGEEQKQTRQEAA